MGIAPSASPRRSRSGPCGEIAVQLVQLAVHQVLPLALFGILEVLVILFIHLRVRSREGGINVLWSSLVLSRFLQLELVEESLFQRPVFIQGTADEVRRVGKINRVRPIVDREGS